MKPDKKTDKIRYEEMNKIAKQIGLNGKNGIYTYKKEIMVDLTACKADMIMMLASVGYQAINNK